MAGSATMSRIDLYGRASPTSSSRANAAVDAAFFSFGLQTPRTSISRTEASDWTGKRALNPLPTKPIPRRSVVMLFDQERLRSGCVGSETQFLAVELRVTDTELAERLGWAAVPIWREDVAHVPEIFHSHLARPEAGRREVAKPVEEADAIGHPGRSARGPGDVVENCFALGLARLSERLAETRTRLGVEPRETVAHPLLHSGPVLHGEVHEPGNARVGGAARPFVPGNDHVGENSHRPIFGGGEKLRRVGGAFCRGT